MSAFWKAFLIFGGIILIIMLAMPAMAGKPYSTTWLITTFEGSFGFGLVAGCLFGLLSWVGKRNQEKQKTEELMRQYLEKKLKEDMDKEN